MKVLSANICFSLSSFYNAIELLDSPASTYLARGGDLDWKRPSL